MLKWIFAICFVASNAQAKTLNILIDPGHGGMDHGAVRENIRESDVVLKVAKQLKNLLDQDSRFKADMTRTADADVGLDARVQKAKSKKFDLMISIHANAADDARAKGYEIYFQNHLPPDEETLFLANLENQKNKMKSSEESESYTNDVQAIIGDLKRQHNLLASKNLSTYLFDSWNSHKSSVIRQAPFYVLTKADVPAVLVEIGYMSNPKELAKLTDIKYQKEIARQLFAGLESYYQKFSNSSAEETLTTP